MSRPLTQPEATQFMADMSSAIVGTPTPGASVVSWNGRNIMITHDAIGNLFFTDMENTSFWGNLLGDVQSIVVGTVYLVEAGPFNAVDQYAQYLLGGSDQYAMSTIAQKAQSIATSAATVAVQGLAQVAQIMGKTAADLTGPMISNLSPVLIGAIVILALYFMHK